MILAAVVVSFLCSCIFVPVAMWLGVKIIKKLGKENGKLDAFQEAVLQRIAVKALEELEREGRLVEVKK